MADSTKTTTYIDGTYFPGVTVYGALAARLVITDDGRLVLTSAEGTPETPVYKEIFNVSAGEVRKISMTADQLTIKLAEKTYRMSVSQYVTPLIAAGGVVGAAVAYGLQRKSGAKAIVDALRALGIKVSYTGIGKLYAIAMAIALGVIVVAVLGYMIFRAIR